jgi:hypothetical protein
LAQALVGRLLSDFGFSGSPAFRFATSASEREFIMLLGGATAAHTWPDTARAQASKILRVGIVSVNRRSTPFFIAFEKRMRELGYDEGSRLAIEFLNVPSPAEYPKAYQELVQRHVDIIIALARNWR